MSAIAETAHAAENNDTPDILRFDVEDAQRLAREQNHIHVPKDDPIMVLVTIINRFQTLQAALIERAAKDNAHELVEIASELRESLKEAVGDLNEAAINSNLKQVLAEIDQKRSQIDNSYQEIDQRLTAHQSFLENHSKNIRKSSRWLSGLNLFSALCIGIASAVVIFQ